MKARTKFLKMYNKLPEQAKTELVYDFTTHPMTLQVCKTEVFANTELGKRILSRLGYIDD